jgi:hypothetical protein
MATKKNSQKEKIERLIKLASQPVESEKDKQRRLASYSDRQTRSRKTASTSVKRSGKSRQSNA